MNKYIPLIVITLTGCAATAQRMDCPLGASGEQCASMQEVHAAAVANGGDGYSVFGSQERRKAKSGRAVMGIGLPGAPSQQAPSNEYSTTLPSHIPSGKHQLAGPVYHPAKPHKIWVAPWTDANGIVHSGESLFFVTPGYWNYGPMSLPGAASGVLGPARPDALGFNPVEAQPQAADEAPIRNGLVRPEGL